MSRTILESVCKYILDKSNIKYKKNEEFSELYRLVSKELNISPNNHNEWIFKQILWWCSWIVNWLASLRNKLWDSHWQWIKKIKPAERHSELAVNLSGTMAIFLLKTFEENKKII